MDTNTAGETTGQVNEVIGLTPHTTNLPSESIDDFVRRRFTTYCPTLADFASQPSAYAVLRNVALPITA